MYGIETRACDPSFTSEPCRNVFVAFVGAAIDYKAEERLPVEIPEPRANGNEHRGSIGQPLPEPAARG